MINHPPRYTESWVGKDGKQYREVSYWVGAGWSANFLQVMDDLGNWSGV